MAPRAEAAGTCSHQRQNWEHGLLPCATPDCREGVTGSRLVMPARKAPESFALAFGPDLEDAVAEEVAMRRALGEYGSYVWKVAL